MAHFAGRGGATVVQRGDEGLALDRWAELPELCAWAHQLTGTAHRFGVNADGEFTVTDDGFRRAAIVRQGHRALPGGG